MKPKRSKPVKAEFQQLILLLRHFLLRLFNYIFIILGFRVVVMHPISEAANWVFRLTEQKNPTHCMKGLKKVFFFIGILPVFILVFLFYFYCWGGVPAVFHSLFSAATAWLFLEIFFINYKKMPFVSGYVPGKAKIKYFWALRRWGFGSYSVSLFMATSDIEEKTPIKYFPVLVNRLQRWNSPGFRLKSQTLKNLHHPETAIPAYMSGLTFIFNP